MKMFAALLSLLSCLNTYSQARSGDMPPDEVFHNPALKRRCLKLSASFRVNPRIPEGSGLAAWNGKLWTHNDSGESALFAIDTANGSMAEAYMLPGIRNNDWEEISQDEDFFYLGAFGNNTGKKDILQILRINKLSLLQNRPVIDTIAFSWPKTLGQDKPRQGNFNCEAMVVIDDSIYLFTKEWKTGRQTRVFSVPRQPGKYSAQYKSTLKTRVLVTGASYDVSKKQLVLCGYNLLLRPFLLVFPDVDGTDFFSGKGSRVKIRKRFRQVEGIATFDGSNYYLINEDFRFWFLHTRQELHKAELK